MHVTHAHHNELLHKFAPNCAFKISKVLNNEIDVCAYVCVCVCVCVRERKSVHLVIKDLLSFYSLCETPSFTTT